MEEKRIMSLVTRLQAMSPADFDIGLPYNDAFELSSGYDEFIECVGVVEEAGRAMGVPEETLLSMRAAYEAIFFPHQYDYILKGGRKLSTVPPQNASEEAGLTQLRIGEHSVFFDLGPYCFEGEAIYCQCKDSLKLVSSHPIMPIGVIINPDQTEKIVIWFKRFGMIKTIEAPRIVVSDKRRINKLINYGVDVNPQLVEFFAKIEAMNRGINPGFEIIVEGTHMGWIDDTYTAFYPYDRASYRCSAISDFKRDYDSVMTIAGTFEEWLNTVNQFRDPDHIVARIVLATSFASVLIKPLSAIPVILHVWGTRSNSGKTMALTTAASVWANPMRGGGFLASMNTTDNKLITRAQFFCNFPLCLDELQTVADKKELQTLIYNLSEGEPRGALTAGGARSRDSGSWENTILTCGEQSILSWTVLAGARNRVIEIHCDDSYIYSDDAAVMAQYLSKLKENHNHAGRKFVECLKQPGNIERANQLYHEYIGALNHRATNKQVLAAAAILTADTLACEWVFHDDLKLTIDDVLPYLKDDDEIDVGTRMQEYINEWIAMNKPRMIQSQNPARILTVKGKQVCAIPSEEFTTQLARKGYDTKAYFSWAREHEQIICDDDGKHIARQISINGVVNRCVCVVLPSDPD